MAVSLRDSNVEKLGSQDYDVLIVGGGINGAVAAASLAGSGVRVALIDRGDFASGVSSNSSNLAWGGIKYLETHEYLLVNKLCKSRNRLMRAYPSTVKGDPLFYHGTKGLPLSPILHIPGQCPVLDHGSFRHKSPAIHQRRVPGRG